MKALCNISVIIEPDCFVALIAADAGAGGGWFACRWGCAWLGGWGFCCGVGKREGERGWGGVAGAPFSGQLADEGGDVVGVGY